MLYGFAQLCALCFVIRPLRGLLLPMGLLFLPIYDMAYPRVPDVSDFCAKETYSRKQKMADYYVAIDKCVERKKAGK